MTDVRITPMLIGHLHQPQFMENSIDTTDSNLTGKSGQVNLGLNDTKEILPDDGSNLTMSEMNDTLAEHSAGGDEPSNPEDNEDDTPQTEETTD